MSHVIDTRLKPVVSGGPRAKPPSHMLAASVGAMRASVCRRRRCARASVPCAAPRRMRRCVRAYDITWWDRGRPFQVRRGPTRDTQATWCSAPRCFALLDWCAPASAAARRALFCCATAAVAFRRWRRPRRRRACSLRCSPTCLRQRQAPPHGLRSGGARCSRRTRAHAPACVACAAAHATRG